MEFACTFILSSYSLVTHNRADDESASGKVGSESVLWQSASLNQTRNPNNPKNKKIIHCMHEAFEMPGPEWLCNSKGAKPS